jgi:hypothetical protein
MNAFDIKRMEMFMRVHEARPEFALASPEGSYGAELFGQLTQVVEDLKSRAFDQSRGQSSARQSSANKAAARVELSRQLEAVHRTARVIAFTNPGLEEKFPSPRGLGDQALLTLARTCGDAALPLKAEFVKRGLGADFIDELGAVAAAFETAINERMQGRGMQVGATAEIDKRIERGLQIVRELSVLILNTYAHDPPKLALWESASHVEKLPRRTRPKTDGNQPPPPAQN